MGDDEKRFRLTRKEWVTLIFGTALALGSFKSDDPWVVIPMLVISGCAFVLLCVWHQGSIPLRALAATALVIVLIFIGWRDLRHGEVGVIVIGGSSVPAPAAPATPAISQTATDSDCSNLVAGSDAQIKCEAEEKRHAKDKTSH
jgi:uncharacterized membrane protein